MSKDMPRPDISRFFPISLELIALAYLGQAKRVLSASTLKSRLSAFADSELIEKALATLIEEGKVTVEKTIVLTKQGREQSKKALGRDVNQDWEKIWQRRLPLIVLGLDPDDPETRQRFAKPDSLISAAIAISFALSTDRMASKAAVCSELVWRILKVALPEVVGKGPLPVIERLGTTERVVLAGLANVRARTVNEAISGLCGAAVGVEKCDADRLRRELIRIGVHRAADKPDIDGFATRVKDVAGRLSTPPFQGRVAIAQVYDEYGRVHPDAGSLANFKERLVSAAKARELDLGRLDMPERMDRDLRLRSEAQWGTDHVHFVVTEWI
jgi:hypothetical protein